MLPKMECNKDEALRAKEIAEQKFSLKDIIGARKLAEKAEKLYPGLEGVSHMLATFDVYHSAEKKLNGETDWYAVLSVDVSADIETIRKQYRKLALVLHPDRNKSIGADGAFNLLAEAWRVLSDKARRLTFDQKTKARGSQQKASESKRSAASTSNPQSKISKNLSSTRKSQNASTVRPPPHQPPLNGSFSCSQQKPSKFWTSCHKCKAQYEYLRIYLNHHLLCASCYEPFVAVEIAKSNSRPESSRFSSQQQKASQSTPSKSSFGSSENTAAAGLATASTLSGAGSVFANVVHQNENLRNQREERQAFANTEQGVFRNSEAVLSRTSNSFNNVTKISEQPLKKRKIVDDSEKGDRPHSVVDNVKYGFGGNQRFQNFDNSHVLSHGSFFSIIEPSGHEMRKILLDKSRKLIIKKISEVNVQKPKTIDSSEKDAPKLNKNKQNALSRKEKNEDGGLAFNDADPNLAPEEDDDLVFMNVPDADFHDFDGDRVEGSVEANQIWAAYDDNDGMPRFYALIHRVLSVKPFRLEFSWLNSRSNNELGPLNWVASGFPKSCGEFRICRHEKCNSVSVFSHKVRWEKGFKGVVKIYPRKADVWALYRNWSPDWDENTADDIIRKYDMVEVLEDYTEEKGVFIVPLLKIAGFKTVFGRHTDAKEMKWIPREEMFRFSHQVPSCMVSSEAAPSTAKGCVELDPAAIFSGTFEGGRKN